MALLPFRKENISQYDRIVVPVVMRAVDEADGSRSGESANAVQVLGVLPKLGSIATLELGPSLRVMAKPQS
jgi:hypothetical protein